MLRNQLQGTYTSHFHAITRNRRPRQFFFVRVSIHLLQLMKGIGWVRKAYPFVNNFETSATFEMSLLDLAAKYAVFSLAFFNKAPFWAVHDKFNSHNKTLYRASLCLSASSGTAQCNVDKGRHRNGRRLSTLLNKLHRAYLKDVAIIIFYSFLQAATALNQVFPGSERSVPCGISSRR